MSMKNTPSVAVALALLAGTPAAALADGIVPAVGKGVGAVVEGTGEALFGTNDKDKVVVKENNPDVVVVEKQRPAVVVADPAPVAVVEKRQPVVVEKKVEPKPDVQVNVNN